MDFFSQVIPHVPSVLLLWRYCFVGNYYDSSVSNQFPNNLLSHKPTLFYFINNNYFFFSYPLFNIPLPGTIPTKVILPYNSLSTSMNLFSINRTDHLEEPNDVVDDNNDKDTSSYSKPKNFLNIDTNKLYRLYNNFSSTSTLLITEPPFPWSRIDPYIYVQQILLKSVVLPWEKNLLLTDAFRGPLFEVFKLLEIINNHEDEQKTTLSNLCLHVENVKRPHKEVLFPEYNCLILSPANLWKQNIHDFNKDSSLLNTIFVHHVSL